MLAAGAGAGGVRAWATTSGARSRRARSSCCTAAAARRAGGADAAESVAAARSAGSMRAHERLGERTAWIEALLGDGEAADAVAPSDAGRSAAELAASAAAAEAAARGTPFDGEAEAIAQARREADDELRALGGCTTPEELEAARAAYERAHPGVFVRKEQGLLLRADVPFPAADRYAAVNFASL